MNDKNTMHILIVDDEVLARQRLVRLSEALGYDVVGEAADGESAITAVENYDPDIVLMDVRMPGIDGLSAAKSISALADPPALIFCTAYDEYALQAFETLATGYLVKPVQQEQLELALLKAMKVTKAQRLNLSSQDNQITPKAAPRKNISAKTRKGIELIPMEDIFCFVADQKYVTVIHRQGETLIDDTLKELETELQSEFIRIHRNSLVAVKEIHGLERNVEGHYEIRLKTVDYRPIVSRRHVSTIKALLASL